MFSSLEGVVCFLRVGVWGIGCVPAEVALFFFFVAEGGFLIVAPTR